MEERKIITKCIKKLQNPLKTNLVKKVLLYKEKNLAIIVEEIKFK